MYLFILPSVGGSVPLVHPRKYAPVYNIKNNIETLFQRIKSYRISEYFELIK